jgi:hypothetical protein
MGGVLARFHPQLHLNLISAGAPGQTAGGLASAQLLQLLTSSRPDWLSLSLGLADASREPALPKLTAEYAERQAARDEDDDTIGPEQRVGRRRFVQPNNGNDPAAARPAITWQLLPDFAAKLSAALESLKAAGVQVALHTPIVAGSDLNYPLNIALRAYGKAVREVASATGSVLIDDERAFSALIDRATTYKQSVTFADWGGRINSKGEALLARTFLDTFGLLPYPGFRPPR